MQLLSRPASYAPCALLLPFKVGIFMNGKCITAAKEARDTSSSNVVCPEERI